MNARDYYNDQYSSGRYANIYDMSSNERQRIRAEHQLHVDLAIYAMQLQPGIHTIVEFGCGIGDWATAWMDRGFTYYGLELSDVAVKQANVPYIQQGSFNELDALEIEGTPVLFSTQVLEHLTDAEVSRLVDIVRRRFAFSMHYIADEVGGDPSHINIKTAEAWASFFGSCGVIDFVVQNQFCPRSPLHVLYLNPDAKPYPIAYHHHLKAVGFIR